MTFKIFHMRQLGIPQERIAKRLGIPRSTLSDHLPELPGLANPANSNLS
jgi:predicted XRE-type DNA-binding protein